MTALVMSITMVALYELIFYLWIILFVIADGYGAHYWYLVILCAVVWTSVKAELKNSQLERTSREGNWALYQ